MLIRSATPVVVTDDHSWDGRCSTRLAGSAARSRTRWTRSSARAGSTGGLVQRLPKGFLGLLVERGLDHVAFEVTHRRDHCVGVGILHDEEQG